MDISNEWSQVVTHPNAYPVEVAYCRVKAKLNRCQLWQRSECRMVIGPQSDPIVVVFIGAQARNPKSHAGGELYGAQIIGQRIMAVRMVRGRDLAIFPARQRGIATAPTAMGVRKRARSRFCGTPVTIELLDLSS